MNIKQWQVYYVPNCRHVRPNPKSKFVVVAYVDIGIPHGFLINSIVNKYVRNQDHLFQCQAQVIGVEHPFLSHDSWVDCQDLYQFTITELTDLKGSLSDAAIGYVMAAIRRCPVLMPVQKQIILDQHNASS